MVVTISIKKITLIIFTLLLVSNSAIGMVNNQEDDPAKTAGKRTNWSKVLTNEPGWFATEEARQIADNVLLYQRDTGGWPKNLNMTRKLSRKEIKTIKEEKKLFDSTIDNGSTFPQMRFLAKVFNATGIEKYQKGFYKGFFFVIKAQYPNGGWPQFYPLRKGYYSHITFNDNAMTGVLFMLRDMAEGHPDFEFMSPDERKVAREASERGLDIILKTQIEVNGKLTGWCAQHDEVSLKPADARSYELASISGMETVALVEFLMTIENPSEQVIKAIQSACAWFEEVKITGYRIHYEKDKNQSKGFNKLLVEDPTAEPLWARFYEIETNQPMYIDRGGIKRNSHDELSAERRNGYSYIGNFASTLLKKKYPQWKKKQGLE